jgi:hypothetical protein
LGLDRSLGAFVDGAAVCLQRARLMCNDYGNRIPYSAYLEAFN